MSVSVHRLGMLGLCIQLTLALAFVLAVGLYAIPEYAKVDWYTGIVQLAYALEIICADAIKDVPVAT